LFIEPEQIYPGVPLYPQFINTGMMIMLLVFLSRVFNF
jgi:hypothetical protein